MAGKQARAAHAESLGEPLSAEESKLMSDNQEAEHEAPEPSPEPAPAPKAEEQPLATSPETPAEADIDPATGKQRKVDYGAFHAEREKRKAAEAREQQKDRDLATALGRFSVLEQLAKQATPVPTDAAVPDINTDPVGHFRARTERAEREIADVNKWRQTQEANATAMNNVQALARVAQTHEAEFSKKTPDYAEAAAFVRKVRDQELQAMGFSDPGVRQQYITQDALQIAAQALTGNMNAAEVVYNIAKARGYPGPKAAAVAVAVPAGDAAKLATVDKGQKQASPLSQANGAAMPELSPEAIIKMSDADFEKWATDGNWRKLMGG